MSLHGSEMLKQLGAGEAIEVVRTGAQLSLDEFHEWWQAEIRSRAAAAETLSPAEFRPGVRIERDSLGIPTVRAENDDDLFFGFGFAMAQDRLFQLDYLRRRGAGRLAEILGTEGVELDRIARTVGLPQIAAREWEQTPPETARLLEAFAAGVNAFREACGEQLPIEFSLLDYVPESWQPIDSLVIAGEFRWYLTGRFPVIVLPELAKRMLGGDGPLFRAYLLTETEDESILPAGSYPKTGGVAGADRELTGGSPDDGSGSNNWVVSGSRTTTGLPLLASDPHIAFAAVSCWYEVALRGGSFDVCGMAYAGMPAVMFGRNRRVAWGITNNICSLRDLFQERVDPAHPGCFMFNGEWRPAERRRETIQVRGGEALEFDVVSSHNGPIVDEILPAPARGTGPVSLRWLGQEYCGWLTSLLGMDRADSLEACRSAMQGWLVPTFSVVMADVDGHIGYKASGRLPMRRIWERGYREGWNPDHQWDGLIPYADMPELTDPPRGYIITANNRVAPDDFPYPLGGTWVNGQRALRIRQMLESRERHSLADFGAMHQDALSLRAVDCVPPLLAAIGSSTDVRVQEAAYYLRGWDCRMEPDRVGASLFQLFFSHWSRAVVDARFSGDAVPLLAGAVGGLATRLLSENVADWFADDEARSRAIVDALRGAIEHLSHKLGDDMLGWSWGRLHTVTQKHFLSGRGDLGVLLDRGGIPVKGDGVTVCNTGFDPNWGASMGAGYRMIADLSDPAGALHAIDAGSESGNPGSRHYDDQLTTWLLGKYHRLETPPTESRGC